MTQETKVQSFTLAKRLTRTNAWLSGLFWLALGFSSWRFHSDLAMAQAADSLLDVFGSFVLAWVVTVGDEPRDNNHPMGHSRAEPLGALLIAMLSAILAIEVATQAIQSLLGGVEMRPSFGLLALFVGKVLFKGTILRLAGGKSAPVFRALVVDSRNDVLVGSTAIFGFALARAGFAAFDAWLSLPIALWIGWSGIELARENIDLLMGAAPSEEIQKKLMERASQVPGIYDVHELRAQYLGTILAVHVHISVDENLSVRAGHDLGEDVREALLSFDEVGQCDVHVDPSTPR